MKDPDYMVNIMISWMTLDELEGENTRKDLLDSSVVKETKQLHKDIRLGFILGADIKLMTKTIRYICRFC